MRNQIIYFAGLNGIRAIAAIAVVITHITISLKDFGLDPHIFGTFDDGKPKGFTLGGYGVSIFFVLSGFLITYLLLVEKKKYSIDIRKFYIRRVLRIWPLYYLYLVLCVITIIIFGFDFDIKVLPLYVFFAANVPFIIEMGIPFISHYWSLGVEEQFYIFWPWIVKKIGYIFLFTLLLVVIILITKTILHIYYPHTLLESIIHVSRFHCMMIGALGSMLFINNNVLFFKIIDNKITQSICWGFIFLVTINRFHIISFLDNEFISVIALFIIIGQIRERNRIINLEKGYFDFLGKISYGIYVIHPLIIFFFSNLFKGIDINIHNKYFLVYFSIVSVTIILSHLSYKYFEKLFLNLKKNYLVVKSVASLRN